MRVLNTIIKTNKVTIVNNNLNGNFQLFPVFTKQIVKLEDSVYEITLNFSVEHSIEKPFPLNMQASMSGIFSFEKGTPESEMENFMNLPAIQIVFPHLRSLVSSVTASCYVQPLLLPLVDPRLFINV
ncbi:protein-export chaperone SecB [Acholeplasma hippikon]|uniref:Preprotein translocase subunit SecB n=1 Tax=Acholeplasma hippikon TaxID=264636 RepID=A0A449BKG3_9MOLU|nr:protein-export chaperone SecB [Acholeplasma hippikon]VEU82934.1 preprotein translocase subunit SecB [Acholeplasma hippikon]